MLYHRKKSTDRYTIRKMIEEQSSQKNYLQLGCNASNKRSTNRKNQRGFDLLRYNTPYLDLLDIYKGYNYLRDLNYSYLREIDYYIQERKRIENLIEEQGEVDGFYDAELEAIEAEIGDINGYLIQDTWLKMEKGVLKIQNKGKNIWKQLGETLAT